jgi:hypothetical protein
MYVSPAKEVTSSTLQQQKHCGYLDPLLWRLQLTMSLLTILRCKDAPSPRPRLVFGSFGFETNLDSFPTSGYSGVTSIVLEYLHEIPLKAGRYVVVDCCRRMRDRKLKFGTVPII